MIKPAIIVKAVMALFPISLTLFVAPVFLTFVLILVYEIAVLYALWEQLKVEEAQGLLQGHPKVAPPAYKEKSDVPYAVLADWRFFLCFVRFVKFKLKSGHKFQ